MKKPALLKAFALLTLILITGCFAQAQIKITPANPNETLDTPRNSGSLTIKCINCTYCDVDSKGEPNNCVLKEEDTTFELDVHSSSATISIVKTAGGRFPIREKFTIESSNVDEDTDALEMRAYNDRYYPHTVTITIIQSYNLISVERPLLDYDDSWDYETAKSKLGGTMEFYEIEH